MTINQELFDRQVEHMLSTRRYQEAARLLIERASNRHRGFLSKLLKKDLKVSLDVQREVTRHVQELYAIGSNAVTDFVGAELDFQTNSLRKSVGEFFVVNSVNRGDLSREITGTPLKLFEETKKHGTLAASIGGIGDAELTRISLRIRRGIAEGTAPDSIIADVLKTTKLTENQAKTLVTTHIGQAETIVKNKVLEANKDVLSGLMFSAILDSRTSKICSYYDGLLQPSGRVTVRPPLHWNCRSTLVPVLKSKKALLDSNSPQVDRAKLALLPDNRLTGALPDKEDFTDWLKRQSMATKLSHLGSEEKVALLENGSLSMKDFFSGKGSPISLAALRLKDNLLTYFGPIKSTELVAKDRLAAVTRPFQLIRSKEAQKDLLAMLLEDSVNANLPLSLTDYRGTTLAGKRGVRARTNNEYDPRNNTFDPFTGEAKSSLYYDPDFTLYRERLDYMRNSKLLDRNQKEFIESFADSLDGRISVNQQTAVVENLRVVLERYQKSPEPWENFAATLRAEMNYSVMNVSRLLDRRSRARSELFLGFKGDPNEPSVMIAGQSIPISKLHSEKLSYEREVQAWPTKLGRPLARSIFYSGKAPWRAYLFKSDRPSDKLFDKLAESFYKRSIRKVFYKDDPVGFYTRYGKTPDKWSKIIKKYLSKKVTPSWWKLVKEISEEGLFDFLSRTVRENYQSLLSLEFLYNSKRKSLMDKLFSSAAKDIEGDAINVISRLIEVVAEGSTTDYDSLAILLGKELQKKWNPLFPFMGSSLQDFHTEGSKVLEYLRDSGLIRVNSRGVTRRATTDLDTGRPSGNWKDTVSREVEILDPDMLRLQDLNRRIELSNRLGVDRPENKYYVVPGKKSYVDARGNDTGVPVVTRSAFANFDEKQIDGDFADMLNHTMAARYEVDDDFAGFMDDLVRFKDQRGRAAYYDSINGFREEIIRRGDQGYGLMEAIRYYRSNGKPFTVHARIDGRGRVYYNGYLTPTGGEVVRPFLNSAKATAMTPEGLFQIRIQMAAVIGPGTEALTNAGRLAIFKRHEKDILRVGELMSARTQRDRRLREFLEDPFIQSIEPEEIAKIARFSLEYYRIYKHTGGDFSPAKLKTYKTKLMGEADASASGLQVIALSTGNRGAALTSNVLPTTRKMRIYDLVAQDVVADPRFRVLMEELGLDLTWEDLSKASKYQVMIALYGAGVPGQTARVALELSKVLRKKDILVTTRAEYLQIAKQIDQKIKEADMLGTEDVKADLLALKKELFEMINDPDKAIGSAILAEAEEIHPDVADLVRKYTNNRGAAVGPDHFKRIAALMSEKLAERAPVTQVYIDFFKRVAQDYARTTKKVRIPWVTYDGKTLYQDYRPKIQQEIRFYDPESRRYIRNIYQMSAEDGKLLGKGQVGDVRLGFGVNGNHALDASLVRGYHLEGRRLSMDTATIHDAIFQNINELPEGINAMFRVYAKARDFNNIKATLDALRKEGLPDDLYRKYLKEAEELGFFSDGFSSKEILQTPPVGYDRYGFGP